MSMFSAEIVPMSEREYRLIPVNEIKVINPRNRNKAQFDENVKNIDNIGLLKPVTVNEAKHGKKGYYELLCGQGRVEAFVKLGRDKIPAEVVTVSDKDGLLISLAENIGRVPVNTLEYAREMKRMKDDGLSISEITLITNKTETHCLNFIKLVEKGEDRLIKAVEDKVISVSLAAIIAKSSSGEIQHVLMDAFDNGMISSSNASKVRNLIEQRLKGKGERKRTAPPSSPYSLKELKDDILRLTTEKENYVSQVTAKENRLLGLIEGLREIRENKETVHLLESESLEKQPTLTGKYSI